MLRSGLLAHLRQQFFAKGFAAQTPTALNLFEILTVLGCPPPLHSGLELRSAGGTILGDPVLTCSPTRPALTTLIYLDLSRTKARFQKLCFLRPGLYALTCITHVVNTDPMS